MLAEQEREGLHSRLCDLWEELDHLLTAPTIPGPLSDAWFLIGHRLQRACWSLGAASYCFHEWAEPDESRADVDEQWEPADVDLSERERGRARSLRSGRRDITVVGEEI